MLALDSLLKDFAGWVQTYGPRVNSDTAIRYSRIVRDFAQRFGHPFYATDTTLRDWFETISSGAAPSTTNQKIAAIRALFAYLKDRKVREDDPSTGIRMLEKPKRLPKPVDHEDILKLIAHIRSDVDASKWHLQDLAIVEVLYGSGLRREEAGSLRLKNIESRESMRVIGKGNKERITILTELEFDAIAAWVAAHHVAQQGDPALAQLARQPGGPEAVLWMLRTRNPEMPLFWNTAGRAVADLNSPGQYLYYRLRRRAKEIGLDIAPHRLRHSFGTELRNGGAPLEEIADVMGHEDIRTTKGYAELSRVGLRAIRRAHTRMGDTA